MNVFLDGNLMMPTKRINKWKWLYHDLSGTLNSKQAVYNIPIPVLMMNQMQFWFLTTEWEIELSKSCLHDLMFSFMSSDKSWCSNLN